MILSILRKSVRYREVSAIKHVRYREVPLYSPIQIEKVQNNIRLFKLWALYNYHAMYNNEARKHINDILYFWQIVAMSCLYKKQVVTKIERL